MAALERSRTVLALDVGGTKLAAGLVSEGGELLESLREPTRLDTGPQGVTRQLVALAHRLLERSALPVVGVGVGCGGPLDTALGLIKSPPNLPGWTDYPLTRRLEEALQLPVWLDNDANAAALAEFSFGAGRGCREMVYLTISTGIGGGLILGGHLYTGKSGNAGELGHIQVVYDGERCNCGGQGCLEQYASGSSIARRARQLAAEHPESLLWQLEPDPAGITAHTILRALEAGDVVVRGFWDQTIQYLAAGVSSVVHTFDPQRVVIGGGITNFGEWLFGPLRQQVARRTMPPLWQGVEIVPAELGDQVGVYGAAAVALRHLEAGLAGARPPGEAPPAPGRFS
ncbi:ROK family protein [Deinococcus irradiatisoli]|nr:ROK family protein [Deinococcus irradiatisoli]